MVLKNRFENFTLVCYKSCPAIYELLPRRELIHFRKSISVSVMPTERKKAKSYRLNYEPDSRQSVIIILKTAKNALSSSERKKKQTDLIRLLFFDTLPLRVAENRVKVMTKHTHDEFLQLQPSLPSEKLKLREKTVQSGNIFIKGGLERKHVRKKGSRRRSFACISVSSLRSLIAACNCGPPRDGNRSWLSSLNAPPIFRFSLLQCIELRRLYTGICRSIKMPKWKVMRIIRQARGATRL